MKGGLRTLYAFWKRLSLRTWLRTIKPAPHASKPCSRKPNSRWGRKTPRVATAEKAVADSQDDGIAFMAATAFVEAGKPSPAKKIAAELGKRLESDPQIYAKLIDGELLLKQGDSKGAMQAFGEAQKLADTWLGRFYLGRAAFESGDFASAASSLDACQKRRGEATSVFLDDEPTFHEFPSVIYYLGRAQESMHNTASADSYKTFLAIKAKGDEGPLVADARKRLDNRK